MYQIRDNFVPISIAKETFIDGGPFKETDITILAAVMFILGLAVYVYITYSMSFIAEENLLLENEGMLEEDF